MQEIRRTQQRRREEAIAAAEQVEEDTDRSSIDPTDAPLLAPKDFSTTTQVLTELHDPYTDAQETTETLLQNKTAEKLAYALVAFHRDCAESPALFGTTVQAVRDYLQATGLVFDPPLEVFPDSEAVQHGLFSPEEGTILLQTRTNVFASLLVPGETITTQEPVTAFYAGKAPNHTACGSKTSMQCA